ncbi:MAG: DEAD/DEAH box helicase, partial [Pseudomonadota bacterium]|nr:DEAD/DEAH box helicase [Pseudomonadota bacterium]
MFQVPADDRPPSGDVSNSGLRARSHAPLGPTVARLCSALARGSVIAVVCGEQRGEAVARAAAAMCSARVLWFPPADALPGEGARSSPAVAGRRGAALSALHHRDGRPVLLVTDASAAAQAVAPPGAFAAQPYVVAPGEDLDGEAFAAELEAIGYFLDERVDEPGEMAIRSGAIDIFPADAEAPVRIHLEGGSVERIAFYNPVTQLGTGDELERLVIRPAAEPPLEADACTIFDHLPDAAVALDPEAEERRDRFIELSEEGPGAPPKPKLVGPEDWKVALAGRTRIDLSGDGEQPARRFVEARNPERLLLTALKEARERGDRVVIAGSARDLRFLSRRIEQRLKDAPRQVSGWSEIERAEPGALLAAEVDFDRGWSEPGLTVIATADALGARARQLAGGVSSNPLLQEAIDFHLGDAVIHEDHGLGVLRGIETVTTTAMESEAVRLEYAGGTQRLVPVEEADRLWRYGAEADAVSLDKPDGRSWEKRPSEIDQAIAQTARQLVELAQARAGETAPVLDPPIADYERFAAGFAFTETPDQLRAIEAARTDLASGKPMDRLVVGDVGYGKTEVALRAAAIAALAGKQVALVAPTTVLVRQHIETFTKRFRKLGIKVAGLSRLSSPAEAREVKKGLADGSIRIVIGTQAIAGKAVSFHDLALVIIDEEQRFGAGTKRKLRDLGAGLHVLTLTATPIPRTLQTALVGLQHLSLITTPPARRLPTRTSVAGFVPELVRPALLREKRRGGQSFVVVPRIEDMEPMAAKLRALVPGLKLRQAHGKMQAAEIDEQMIRFSSGDGDILLATNIIEAGLDIPRANTMIIWRADRFGLAQLHQLRGRVGRGRARGHLLLLTEAGTTIAPATMKRLRTMEALDQLGAGFAISARDLDLRGAGELLGEQQAGHMKLIGLGLYQHLLEQALRVARREDVDDWMPELSLGLSGRLPESWIPEEEVRINLYVRLARTASAAQVDSLAEELEDRFGGRPAEARRLVELARIRLLARAAKVARVDAGPAAIALTPRRDFGGDWKSAGLVDKG